MIHKILKYFNFCSFEKFFYFFRKSNYFRTHQCPFLLWGSQTCNYGIITFNFIKSFLFFVRWRREHCPCSHRGEDQEPGAEGDGADWGVLHSGRQAGEQGGAGQGQGGLSQGELQSLSWHFLCFLLFYYNPLRLRVLFHYLHLQCDLPPLRPRCGMALPGRDSNPVSR